MCYSFKGIEDKKIDELLKILEDFTYEDLDKSLISYSNFNHEILHNIEKVMMKFFNNKINNIRKKYDLVNELINIDIKNFDKYIEKKKILYEKSIDVENKYFNKYFKNLDYKRLNNKDKL